MTGTDARGLESGLNGGLNGWASEPLPKSWRGVAASDGTTGGVSVGEGAAE
jgi:hypothetical protein